MHMERTISDTRWFATQAEAEAFAQGVDFSSSSRVLAILPWTEPKGGFVCELEHDAGELTLHG